jgi:hypothetical protein
MNIKFRMFNVQLETFKNKCARIDHKPRFIMIKGNHRTSNVPQPHVGQFLFCTFFLLTFSVVYFNSSALISCFSYIKFLMFTLSLTVVLNFVYCLYIPFCPLKISHPSAFLFLWFITLYMFFSLSLLLPSGVSLLNFLHIPPPALRLICLLPNSVPERGVVLHLGK